MIDDLNHELDRRKPSHLPDITDAAIVSIVCPNDASHYLTDDGMVCAVCLSAPVEEQS